MIIVDAEREHEIGFSKPIWKRCRFRFHADVNEVLLVLSAVKNTL